MHVRPTVTLDARMLRSSGIGRVVTKLAQGLPQRVPDADWVLLYRHEDAPAMSSFHHEHRCIPCGAGIYSIRETLEIPRRIPKNNSVFISPHYNAPLFAAGNLLTVVHDLCHFAHPEFFPFPIRRCLARARLAAALRRSRKIVCVSDFTRFELQRLFPRDAARADVHTIHSGIPLIASFDHERREPDGAPYFLVLGNLKPHKNLTRTIQAYLSIHSEIPEKLLIVGRMDNLRSVDRQAIHLARQHPSAIAIESRADDSRLQQLLRQARGLVFPSIYEGFGFPPLEAMAAGIPVLAGSIGVADEAWGAPFTSAIETPAGVAMRCDPLSETSISSALIAFSHASQTDRACMIRNGHRHAAKFDWDTALDRYAKAVRDLLP